MDNSVQYCIVWWPTRAIEKKIFKSRKIFSNREKNIQIEKNIFKSRKKYSNREKYFQIEKKIFKSRKIFSNREKNIQIEKKILKIERNENRERKFNLIKHSGQEIC